MSSHFRFLHLCPRESPLGLNGKKLLNEALMGGAVHGNGGSSSVVHLQAPWLKNPGDTKSIRLLLRRLASSR